FLSSHGIKLGRDGLFDLLSAHNLLIKRRKRSAKTTQSYHHYRKHPNLIQGFEATAPNQLWVSDLTYWRVEEGFYYISLITDAYSRKIVGYHVGESLEVVESLSALKMALSTRKRWERDRTESPEVIKRVQGVQGVQGGEPIGLIHHSDRGIQYCSTKYVKLLEKNGIAISMTQSGDPLDNALAERVNGILKGEYLEELRVSNL
ncbi:MAG: IS3 family transposase, partial [Bacteroidota bacterium]